MNQFVDVMKSLSDPIRVKIVKMLQHRSMCVCELQAALGVAQPTVSKHLKILDKAGLVGCRKDGLWVDYFLADGCSSPYAAVLLGNMRHWMEENEDVVDLVERLPFIRRENICKKTEPVGPGRCRKQKQGAAVKTASTTHDETPGCIP